MIVTPSRLACVSTASDASRLKPTSRAWLAAARSTSLICEEGGGKGEGGDIGAG